MKPGELATCSACGSTATAYTTGPSVEGGAVLLSWKNGPHARHETAAGDAPTLCVWCRGRAAGWPSVMDHPLVGETWTVTGPKLSYEIPALRRSAGAGPLNAGREDVREEARPRPATDGNKARLERSDDAADPDSPGERYGRLAAEYRADTGAWPCQYPAPNPGDRVDADMDGWRNWCAARAAAAAPKKAPSRGQIGLFG